ncbi:MAG: hypothetical protein LC748_00625 [Thermomicrobia bacterium]|nr:hypothetical protein [Thermomicrobia bacterium]
MPDEQQQEQINDEQGDEQHTQRGAGSDRQDGGDDLAGLKGALEKERTDRKKFEREMKQLADWKRQREQADMSDTEKRDARIREYEAKEQAWEREKRDLRLQTAITAAGTKAGALYPEQLYKLVEDGAIEWNDATGQPRNLTATINSLKTEYPALFRTHGGAGNADAGAGAGGMSRALSHAWRGGQCRCRGRCGRHESRRHLHEFPDSQGSGARGIADRMPPAQECTG